MIDLQPHYNITAFLPTSPVDGQIWDDLNTKFSWKYSTSTGLWSVVPTYGIGGNLVQDIVVLGQTYRVHSFTDTTKTQLFSVSSPVSVQYLVVGGGGGSSSIYSGGGGAGGYRCSVPGELSGGGASAEPLLNLAVSSYVVTVGGGALSGNGSSSIFATITALGGGYGGSAPGPAPAGLGSGGGGGPQTLSPIGADGTAGQGFRGGSSSSTNSATSGGGGAGGVGGDASGTTGGSAGIGVSSSITGSAVTRGVGGKGADYLEQGASGAANTGNGARGGWNGQASSGGSGIVILRYAI